MSADPPTPLHRVTFDASVLLGKDHPRLIAGASLGLYVGYWSPWIVSEFVRKRTEWIAERAMRDGVDRAELRRRLSGSRERVNRLVEAMSRVLTSVDLQAVPDVDLSWLHDPDDWPVMHAVLVAQADRLVTDNSRDFPNGEQRSGIVFMTSRSFLAELNIVYPQALINIERLLRGAADPPTGSTNTRSPSG